MKSTSLFREHVRIATGVACEFTFDGARVECRWTPEPPKSLSGQSLRRYRRAREGFMRKVCDRMGQSVVAVDLLGMTPGEIADVQLAFATPGGSA